MSAAGAEGLAEVRERCRAEGMRLVQVEVPELDGGLRGKLPALDKGLSGEIGFSNIIYGLTTADDVYLSPFSNYENGFADVYGQPDAATMRRLPWRPETVAVVLDLHDADGAMRAKTYLKKLCAEHGMVATFMAKLDAVLPGSGEHVHQREPLARRRERLLGRRQLQRGAAADHPARAARRALREPPARRPIPTPTSPSAALLAAGLDGIEPPPLCSGNAALDERYTRLPATLEEAVEVFAGSDFLRRAFTDRSVDHYALSCRAELDLWRAWQKGQVSAWEYERYFETI